MVFEPAQSVSFYQYIFKLKLQTNQTTQNKSIQDILHFHSFLFDIFKEICDMVNQQITESS